MIIQNNYWYDATIAVMTADEMSQAALQWNVYPHDNIKGAITYCFKSKLQKIYSKMLISIFNMLEACTTIK